MMSERVSVQIPSLPTSIEEFLDLRDRVATTPEGGAATMVVALLAYAETEGLGQECLACAVGSSRLVDGAQGYRGRQLSNASLQRIRTQLRGRDYLLRSYVGGTEPEDGYQLGSPPYWIECLRNPHSGDPASGRCKVFVASSGADSPRPVTVALNENGIWKAMEWSSLVVGVRPPIEDTHDEL
jgi:hypothetical protein